MTTFDIHQLESGHQPAESVKEVPVATSVPAKARKKPRSDEDGRIDVRQQLSDNSVQPLLILVFLLGAGLWRWRVG